MSLTTYPDIIVATYSRTPHDNVLIDTYEGKKEQRRQKSDITWLTFDFSHVNLDGIEARTLTDFWKARKTFEAFRFLDLDDFKIIGEVVDASYNGTDATSQLGHKLIVPGATTRIYDDGNPLISGVNYNLDVTPDTGTITWIINPVALSIITADYHFHIRSRFALPISSQRDDFDNYVMRVSIIEVVD